MKRFIVMLACLGLFGCSTGEYSDPPISVEDAGAGGDSSSSTGEGGSDDVFCQINSDCPESMEECFQSYCNEQGYCDLSPRSGDLTESQTTGDCQVEICDQDGNKVSIADNLDVLDDGNACTYDSCQDGQNYGYQHANDFVCGDNGLICWEGSCQNWKPIVCQLNDDVIVHSCPDGNMDIITDPSLVGSTSVCQPNNPYDGQHCAVGSPCWIVITDDILLPGHCL